MSVYIYVYIYIYICMHVHLSEVGAVIALGILCHVGTVNARGRPVVGDITYRSLPASRRCQCHLSLLLLQYIILSYILILDYIL